jgi:hypothetical protein
VTVLPPGLHDKSAHLRNLQLREDVDLQDGLPSVKCLKAGLRGWFTGDRDWPFLLGRVFGVFWFGGSFVVGEGIEGRRGAVLLG